MNNHVILCGLGELGFRTLERLRAFGDDVVVMDPRPSMDFHLQLTDWKIKLIQDAGRNPRSLREAGILTARAVIATTGDDLTNLGIALAAREENPDVLLVVRLFNQRMVEKVQRDIPHCRVLDVAALVAPVFAYAGLHDDILHILDVPGGRYLLKRWRGAAPSNASVIAIKRMPRETYETAGPGGVGFSMTARADWDPLPIAARAVAADDESYGLVAIDGEETVKVAMRLPEPMQRARRSRWAREMRRRLTAFGQNRLIPIILIMSLITVVSVIIFKQALQLDLSQALYFVITIMTTTGFGDITVKDKGPAIVLYVSALMVVGSVLMAVLYAYVTEGLLSLRLGTLLDRRPVPQRGHFVVFGLGTIGFRIAEELQRLGYPTVAVEKQENSRLVERARRLGVKVLVSQDVFGALGDVNLEEARCVLTVTDDDALNLEVALTAQERNANGRVVVRFFDPHMAGLLERTFGIHLARSPSAIAAPAFAVAAASDDLYDAFDLGDELWCAGRVTLTAGHALIGLNAPSLHALAIMPLTYRNMEGKWAAFPKEMTLVTGLEILVVTPHDTWLKLQSGQLYIKPRGTGRLT